MSLSAITKGPTSTNGVSIYCQNVNCDAVSTGSMTAPSMVTDTITVNQSYTSNATPPTTTSFTQSLLLSDGSTTQILQSDNLLGLGVKGSAIQRTNTTNKRSSVGVVNASSLGGPESAINTIIQDTVIPTDLAMNLVAHDGVNYSYLCQVNQGLFSGGFGSSQGNTSMSGNQTVEVSCTPSDRLQLNSATGLSNLQGTVGVILASPFAQITALTNPDLSSLVTTQNDGTIGRIRYEQAYYGPVVTNVNRITGSTGFASQFTVVGEICYVNCKVQVVVGVGVGPPSFFLSLPIGHTPFATDVVFGTGSASDAGLTTSLVVDVSTQTPAGTDALMTITNAVAATYNCKFSFSYPIS